MDKAAPARAAVADEDALKTLRYGWGDAYRIGWDPGRGWWACRRDASGEGGDMTAGDADGLWQSIHEDYDRKPVPRDVFGDTA